MPFYTTKRVRAVLQSLGLHPLKGKAEGHEFWGNDKGRTCRPRLHSREMALAHVFSLGHELEAQGICSRTDFLRAVKGR